MLIIRLLISNYKIKWHERTLIGYMLFILDNRIGSLENMGFSKRIG